MPLIPGEAETDRSLSSRPAWTTDLTARATQRKPVSNNSNSLPQNEWRKMFYFKITKGYIIHAVYWPNLNILMLHLYTLWMDLDLFES